MRYPLAMLTTGALTAGVCSAWIHHSPERFFEPSYAQFEHTKELTAERSDTRAPWIALGDSRVKAAILPSELGPGSVSLSMAGASPLELYYTLERYLETHPAPVRALVAIAPVHFHGQFLFWDRTIKFRYLDDAEIDDVFRTADALHDEAFGGPWRERIDLAMYRANLLHLYFPELEATLLRSRAPMNAEILALAREGRGHLFFGTAESAGGPGYEVPHATFEPAPIYEHYLRRLLDRLLEEGVEVRYQAMPVNRRTAESIHAAYREGYERTLARIAADYPNIRFEYRLPVLPDDCFGDENHLNARGAELVTRAIRDGRTIVMP